MSTACLVALALTAATASPLTFRSVTPIGWVDGDTRFVMREEWSQSETCPFDYVSIWKRDGSLERRVGAASPEAMGCNPNARYSEPPGGSGGHTTGYDWLRQHSPAHSDELLAPDQRDIFVVESGGKQMQGNGVVTADVKNQRPGVENFCVIDVGGVYTTRLNDDPTNGVEAVCSAIVWTHDHAAVAVAGPGKAFVMELKTVATIDLLDAGAGSTKAAEPVLAKAGFKIKHQGKAGSPHPRTEIYFGPAFDGVAKQVAKALGVADDAVKPRDWKSPYAITVALGPAK